MSKVGFLQRMIVWNRFGKMMLNECMDFGTDLFEFNKKILVVVRYVFGLNVRVFGFQAFPEKTAGLLKKGPILLE